MRIRLIFAAIALLVGCTKFSPNPRNAADPAVSVKRFDWEDEVIVVAHRACWRSAPENSISAIRQCIDRGVTAIEIDVRRTADDILVLMHDETADRTTSGTGKVSELTYYELSGFRLRNRDGGPATGMTNERPPTLRDAFEASKGALLINIDAKEDVFGDAYELAAQFGIQDLVLFKKETPFSEEEYRSLGLPDGANFMNKITQSNGGLAELAYQHEWTDPIALEIKFSDESYVTEFVELRETRTLRFWVNTMSGYPEKNAGHSDELAVVDPEEHWGRLIELGFTMIQTDEPESLLAYLKASDD